MGGFACVSVSANTKEDTGDVRDIKGGVQRVVTPSSLVLQ